MKQKYTVTITLCDLEEDGLSWMKSETHIDPPITIKGANPPDSLAVLTGLMLTQILHALPGSSMAAEIVEKSTGIAKTVVIPKPEPDNHSRN